MVDAREPKIDKPKDRRRRIRIAAFLLILAIALVMLALLLYALSTPAWLDDGARPAYDPLVRALLVASLAAGTVLLPVALRAGVLALLPSRIVGLILGVTIGIFGAVVVPLEVWMAMELTAELEPGTRERWESDPTDWGWD